ncbi:hypothetical protein AB0M50_09275 [Nonomuraea fuscirosea]|uniref:hypothetical protein n=1 Tax=Nonomuraea fuscirosea TaxID=1291556 RepID=UPI003418BD0C
MRRLSTSRTVWLAITAVLAAAAALLVALLAVRRTRHLTRNTATHPPPPPTIPIIRAVLRPEPEPVPERPAPVPILGIPTAADLERFAPKPSFLDRSPSDPPPPRAPLTQATRRRLTLWGALAAALLLLASCTLMIENTVYDRDPTTEYVDEVDTSVPGESQDYQGFQDEMCDPTYTGGQPNCQ